jgi:flagellar assembly protein FliH
MTDMASRILGDTSHAAPILWRSADVPSGGSGPAAAIPGFSGALPNFEARLQAAYQQGLAAGEATAAQRAGTLAAPVLQNFGAVVRELAGARQQARRESEESMVRLAIAIAQRVLHREISTDPLAILGLVRAGLDRLSARELHRLRLSPGDAQIARDNRADLQLPPAVEILADPALAPGSAIFETERGDLDASISTQLAEIERGFADLVVRRRG